MADVTPLIESLLLTNGVASVKRVLADAGIEVAYNRIDTIRKAMEKDGRRQPLNPAHHLTQPPLPAQTDYVSAREGCDRLLRAQVRAGQVFGTAMARWQAKHGVAA